MIVAVTGPQGQLGSELVKQGCIPLLGKFHTYRLKNNIAYSHTDTIINCAAYTDVDGCEGDLAKSVVTNTEGVSFLSDYIPTGYLIEISTDYVFDGQSGPYSPGGAPNPLSIYGWSKLGGELITRRHKGPWLIVRTTILFSGANNNFAAKIVKKLVMGDRVTLYQPGLSGTPTYVPALAKEIIRIVKEGYTGIAHIAGGQTMTRLEFARLIAETFGFNPDDIIPSDGPMLPNSAPRPPLAGLICDHSGYRPINSHDIREGLAELAQAYKRGEIWR